MANPSGFSRPTDEAKRVAFIEQVEAACRDLDVDLTWESSAVDRHHGARWRTPARGGVHVRSERLGCGRAGRRQGPQPRPCSRSLRSRWSRIESGASASSTVRPRPGSSPTTNSCRSSLNRSGGTAAQMCTGPVSLDELAAIFNLLRSKHPSVVVSPLLADAVEYRLVVLDGHVLLAFLKRRSTEAEGRPFRMAS